tara:strand:- start:93 stop:749 length:657 start_codon:yes stop_codon:yes gene_type:complete
MYGDPGLEAWSVPLTDSLQRLSDAWGPVVSSENSNQLNYIIGGLESSATVILMPGIYFINSTLEITKPCTIRGVGMVKLICNDTVVNIPAEDANGDDVSNVHFENIWFKNREDDTASKTTSCVTLNANTCSLTNCVFEGTVDRSVIVSGDYCAIRMCRTIKDASHPGSGVDFYFNDGATYGIVHGSMWSQSRTHVLSYRAADNMSQAANGPSAVLNVR